MNKDTHYQRGKELSEVMNPGMESVLADRYDHYVPGLSETVVDVAYGQFYSRDGLDERTRILCTISALTAMGQQTKPQLQVNIRSALKLGVEKHEICEAIYQMTLYGGFPAMINGMNAAIEVFETEEPS